MTIRRNIDANALSDAMTKFEDAARDTPEGICEDAKALSEIFSGVFRHLRAELKAADIGLTLPNDDRYREFEAVMYGMLKAGNPDATIFAVTEGIGEHLDGPAGERVLAGLIRDRDFLRGVGSIPQGSQATA